MQHIHGAVILQHRQGLATMPLPASRAILYRQDTCLRLHCPCIYESTAINTEYTLAGNKAYATQE